MISVVGVLFGNNYVEDLIKVCSKFKSKEELEFLVFINPSKSSINETMDDIKQKFKEYSSISFKLYILVKAIHLTHLLNVAVKEAKGDYITFIDGRDLYKEDYLDIACTCLENEDIDIFSINKYFCYSEVNKILYFDKSLENFHLFCTMFYRQILLRNPFPNIANTPGEFGNEYVKKLENDGIRVGVAPFKIYMHVIKNNDIYAIATDKGNDIELLKEEVSKDEALEYAFEKNPIIYNLRDKEIQPKLSTLPLEDLPHISLVTPTKNRKNLFWMALQNVENQTYPKDKIEWIIGDDSKDSIEDILPKWDNIKYYYTENIDNIGAKRNFCIEKASHDIIVFMDDDDFHTKQSIEIRVRALLGQKCLLVGSQDMMGYYIDENEYHYMACKAKRQIHEGTMAFYKSFWNERKFNEMKKSEGSRFIDDRLNKVHHMTVTNIMIMIAHPNNTCNKNPFLNLPIIPHSEIMEDDHLKSFMKKLINKYS